MDVQPVFAVCLQAELVPASVQDYREKLLHLRKLRHDLVQRSLPQGPSATFQQVLRTTPTDDFDLCFFFSSFHVVVQLPLFDSNHLQFFLLLRYIVVFLFSSRFLCVSSSRCSLSTSGLCGTPSLT